MKNFLVGASLLSLSPATSQADVIVDNFSDSGDISGVTLLVVSPGVPSATSYFAGLSGVIGGQRQMTLQQQGNTSPNITTAVVSDTPPPTFSFNASATSDAKITFRYGSAINAGSVTPLGFNFNANGITSLDLNVGTYNPPNSGTPLVGLVTLLSGGTSATSISRPLVGTSGPVTFPFDTPAFSGFNFNSVDGIRIEVDGAQGADFDLTSIDLRSAAVPEPSSTFALSLLLTSGIFARRRRTN